MISDVHLKMSLNLSDKSASELMELVVKVCVRETSPVCDTELSISPSHQTYVTSCRPRPQICRQQSRLLEVTCAGDKGSTGGARGLSPPAVSSVYVHVMEEPLHVLRWAHNSPDVDLKIPVHDQSSVLFIPGLFTLFFHEVLFIPIETMFQLYCRQTENFLTH